MTEESKHKEIKQIAIRMQTYCNLLIEQCNNWFSPQEAKANSMKKKKKSNKRNPNKLFFYCLCLLSIFACNRQTSGYYTAEEKAIADSLITSKISVDSLEQLKNRFVLDENLYGEMRIYTEMGRRTQGDSEYKTSLEFCQKALDIAEQAADTLEIMNILSTMGTNLRRLGAMGDASSYFYKTLSYHQSFSDKANFQAMKTRLIALNSIGNINKTLGNTETADSLFRLALIGSMEIDDKVGCAVNYANIGLNFEEKRQFDSAWWYQRKAMEYNKVANYRLGIAITHINYGKLYEKQGDYENAMREYQISMDSTKNMENRWQWLMSSTKWMQINIRNGNLDGVGENLDLAERYAKEIHSVTHQSDVARLKSLYFEAKGNQRAALEQFKVYKFFADSLRNSQSSNQIHNLQLQYERENSNREMADMQHDFEMRERNSKILFFLGTLALLLTIAAIVFLAYALRMRTRSQRATKELDQMRSTFYTNITHEFRTPLTVILGIAEQLKQRKENNPEAETIICQGNILLDMVNQLLDTAKIKSRADQSKWLHGDVVTFVGMGIVAYRDYATTKGIELNFNPESRTIAMDFVPEYFDKILRNLLSNALKHTTNGGTITVSVTQKNEKFFLTVSDTGNGIDPDDLPHIFEEFYQGKQSYNETGTGIGLAFVQKMVESMKGTITAANRLEGGAEFCIALPVKQDLEIAEIWNQTKYPQNGHFLPKIVENNDTSDDEITDRSKPNILIIEDNADIRRYIASLLKNRYQVRFAVNGEEGIGKAKDFMPDLMITDLMMPVMDGYAVCRAIRESEILNHIPIIVITAKTTEEDKRTGLIAGADAYLYKPFNAVELTIRIEKLLEQRRVLREKYSKAMLDGVSENVELSVNDRRFLDKTIAYVYDRISDTNLNGDELADKMCMSRSQLNRKIRSITGYSIAAYILHIRLEKAKRMLVPDETPIGEIAMRCGFEDSNYFSRVFRQVYKVTPSQYRKNH